MKYLIYIILPILLLGCGGGSLVKKGNKWTWNSNQRTLIKYEKDGEKLEIDNRGNPILNVGSLAPKIIP